jgi:hypothetical protein
VTAPNRGAGDNPKLIAGVIAAAVVLLVVGVAAVIRTLRAGLGV